MTCPVNAARYFFKKYRLAKKLKIITIGSTYDNQRTAAQRIKQYQTP